MGKLHTRRRGIAKSLKPYATAYPTWLTKSADEIKEDVINMANKDVPPTEIGNRLRDLYGVGNAKDVLGDSITTFLQKNGILASIPHDLECLVNRMNVCRVHLNVQKKDLRTKYKLTLLSAKMHRLARYYRRTGRIPGNWKPKLTEFRN